VTGAARRAEQATAQAAASPQQRAMPTFGAAPPSPRSHQGDSGLLSAGQPRLGIEQPTRSKTTKSEDDLLEIPAFLRRQAN